MVWHIKGITVLNSPGTIDADYRGEIGVILINLSEEDFVVADGERIAQMIVAPYTKAQWLDVEELSTTERDEGGLEVQEKLNIRTYENYCTNGG